ncbi:MAG: hypothetical protein EOO43_23565 [Flavobacterium sp.]|nr:MAG: hypothetical protein EOO43_23565 [Flavobacterium sp.]
MNWLTEHSIWVLLGLIIFMAVWFVAFFARNHQAKKDEGSGLNTDANQAGTAPIRESDKN